MKSETTGIIKEEEVVTKKEIPPELKSKFYVFTVKGELIPETGFIYVS